ncbi:MAG: hypothetical protein K2X04_05975 [Burkholderiales bacterium]|nr:hypothetical protein [Burkholderiales bacterium]
MTTPTIKKLNLTLITAVAALIASCNSGSSRKIPMRQQLAQNNCARAITE